MESGQNDENAEIHWKTLKIRKNSEFWHFSVFPLGLVRVLDTSGFSGFGSFEQISIVGRPLYLKEAWWTTEDHLGAPDTLVVVDMVVVSGWWVYPVVWVRVMVRSLVLPPWYGSGPPSTLHFTL